jgi:hypothetical protein
MFQILSNSLCGEHAKISFLLRLTCLIEEWWRTNYALVEDRRKKTSYTLYGIVLWLRMFGVVIPEFFKKTASWLQVSCIFFNKPATSTVRKI